MVFKKHTEVLPEHNQNVLIIAPWAGLGKLFIPAFFYNIVGPENVLGLFHHGHITPDSKFKASEMVWEALKETTDPILWVSYEEVKEAAWLDIIDPPVHQVPAFRAMEEAEIPELKPELSDSQKQKYFPFDEKNFQKQQ